MIEFLKRKGFVLAPQCGPDYWERTFPVGNVNWRINVSFDTWGVQFISIGSADRGCVTLFREDMKLLLPILRTMTLLMGKNEV